MELKCLVVDCLVYEVQVVLEVVDLEHKQLLVKLAERQVDQHSRLDFLVFPLWQDTQRC